jgi:hypothetical protein
MSQTSYASKTITVTLPVVSPNRNHSVATLGPFTKRVENLEA